MRAANTVKSLKVLACLEVIRDRNLTLADVVHGDNEDISLIDDACFNSTLFWSTLLVRQYGEFVLLSRLDIDTASMLRSHAEHLVDGITNRFTIVADWGQRSAVVVGPEPYRDNDGYEELYRDDDAHVIHFNVPGLPPSPGSIGYLVRFYFDDPVLTLELKNMSEPQIFLCFEEDIAETTNIMKTYIYDQMAAVYQQYIPPQTIHVNGVVMDEFNAANMAPVLNNLILAGLLDSFDAGRMKFDETIIGITDVPDVVAYPERLMTIFVDIAQLRF